MIALTGGAGFIGSAVLWCLNGEGVEDALVVDEKGDRAKERNLEGLRFGDYVGKEEFLDAVEEGKYDSHLDCVIHLGAESSTTVTDREYLRKNNFEYTKTLAGWAVKHGKRFVYASSASTYGDGSAGYSDDEKLLSKLKPLNAYAESKQMFDLWAVEKGILGKIAGLKYFNVFGPNEYHKGEMRSVVHKAFEQIRATGKVKLFKSHRPGVTDGGQSRDFIYVKDAAAITLYCCRTPKANGIINVGTGRARSFLDLARAVFAAMGAKENIEFIDMPEELRGRYQYFTQADISKLRCLGYKKGITALEDAVKDYVGGYLMAGKPFLGNGGKL